MAGKWLYRKHDEACNSPYVRLICCMGQMRRAKTKAEKWTVRDRCVSTLVIAPRPSSRLISVVSDSVALTRSILVRVMSA
jgi:hypothetical protein